MKEELTDEEINEREEKTELLHAIRRGGRQKNKKTFIEVCRYVLEHGYTRYKGILIDHFSASAFVTVFDKINAENQEKLSKIANENPSKAMSIVWKLVK